MESIQVVSRYEGSMGGIAVAHGAAAYLVLFRPDAVDSAVRAFTHWIPGLGGGSLGPPGPGWILAGAYLVVQGLAFALAALFPRHWGYRVVCLGAAAAASASLVFLYLRHGRPLLLAVAALWEGSHALWVAWLVLLELRHHPFAQTPA